MTPTCFFGGGCPCIQDCHLAVSDTCPTYAWDDVLRRSSVLIPTGLVGLKDVESTNQIAEKKHDTWDPNMKGNHASPAQDFGMVFVEGNKC